MKDAWLYVIVVLLLILVSCGVTYIIVDLTEEKTVEKSYTNIPKEDSTIDEEEILLTEEELEEYLDYIPYYLPIQFEAYSEDIIIDDVDQEVLIAMALGQGMSNYYDGLCDGEICGDDGDSSIAIKYLYDDTEGPVYGLYYFTLNYINDLLDNMYNIQFYNLEETTS